MCWSIGLAILWLSNVALHAAPSITPGALEFDARLNEPALVTMEVKGDGMGELSVEVEGFDCDRRIAEREDGGFLVEIAPQTGVGGNFRGKVVLKSNGAPISEPIPISGVVRPWIKVTPSKLFAGSIGHGGTFESPRSFSVSLSSNTEPFDITGVRFPEIPGGTWSSDPPPGVPGREKKLTLSFSPAALAEGFPFGALAMKYVLIETTHAEMGQCAIAITGMISVNTTGRNYSEYLYKGELRWQGPWGTPNIAAVFLGAGVLFLCGIGTIVHKKILYWRGLLPGRSGEGAFARLWLAGILALVIFAGMAWGCLLLAKTYSRGGWVAMGAGVVVMIASVGRPRFFPISLACVLAISVAMHPAGLERAVSSAEVTSDKSVSHRLLLWKGALQMIAEHPWTGVGAEKFGEIFSKEYQLPLHTQSYSTAINDYLTLGAERGVPALAGLVAIVASLSLAGLWGGARSRNAFVVTCASILAFFLIACWFSSVMFQRNCFYLVLVPSLGVAAGLLWEAFRSKPMAAAFGKVVSGVLKTIVLAGCIAIATASCVLLAGQVAVRERPGVTQINLGGVEGLKVAPRDGSSKGTILYIAGRTQNPNALVKSTLRPLAAGGWTVFCFELSKYPSQAYLQLQSILTPGGTGSFAEKNRLAERLVIAGHGQGAQLAVALAAEGYGEGVAAYAPPVQSPFPELSASGLVAGIRIPVVLCAQEADANSMVNLERMASGRKGETIVSTHPGQFSETSKQWQLWIDDVLGFADSSLRRPEAKP